MEWVKSLYSEAPILQDVPVYGAGSAIPKGAVLIRGTTDGTNIGMAILATAALPGVVGVLYEAHAAETAGDDNNAAGTNRQLRKVIVDPFAIYRAEYDQDDTVAVASSSGTTVVITSAETNLQGGWLYAVSGTGAGRLTLVTADDGSNNLTTKEETGWDSTTTVIKIMPLFTQLIKMNSAMTKIGSDAAAGSGKVALYDNWMQADGIGLVRLDPTVDSGRTGLNTKNVKFFGDILFRDHLLNNLA